MAVAQAPYLEPFTGGLRRDVGLRLHKLPYLLKLIFREKIIEHLNLVGGFHERHHVDLDWLTAYLEPSFTYLQLFFRRLRHLGYLIYRHLTRPDRQRHLFNITGPIDRQQEGLSDLRGHQERGRRGLTVNLGNNIVDSQSGLGGGRVRHDRADED